MQQNLAIYFNLNYNHFYNFNSLRAEQRLESDSVEEID